MKRKEKFLGEEGCSRVGIQILASVFALILLPIAKADVSISVQEGAGGVVITADGSLNLSALQKRTVEVFSNLPSITPDEGEFSFGPATGGAPSDIGDNYEIPGGVNRPSNFGTGDRSFPSNPTSSGSVFGFSLLSGASPPQNIKVPNNYSSGSPISASMTFPGESITSLGLAPGEYTWSWGVSATAETIRLTIPQPGATPAPVVDNTAAIAALNRKVKRLKSKLRNARRKGQAAKGKKIRVQIRRTVQRLRAL